jgi:hypothetical protein
MMGIPILVKDNHPSKACPRRPDPWRSPIRTRPMALR